MLDLEIVVKDKKSSINLNTAYLEKTMYAQKKADVIKERYEDLVKKLDTDENIDAILSMEKDKDPLQHWLIAKDVADFIREANKEAVNITNLSTALSKSIGGNSAFWDLRLRFYRVNPNKEYTKYKWWFCHVLADTINPETRKILITGYENNKIKNQNACGLWKDVIERGEVRKLPRGRREILEILSKGDETELSLSEKTHLSKDSVRGRISELEGLHGYKIPKKGEFYHLVPNDEERRKIIEDAKKEVKKIKDL